MFHCLVIKVLNLLSLRQLVYFITFISACQVLFLNFFEVFLMFVLRSQATFLLYHILTGLSTTFFVFFKTFQIVYSEETILRDSSVRITLSNRAVNTFLKFFTKTSTCINQRYHRPFRSHGTFIDHLLIKKCKILFCRFFCCFCRSLCIISCPYRS